MAQAYFHSGRTGSAAFDLFVRNYPPDRGYLVCAGLEDALNYLESFGFDDEAIDYLNSTRIFASDFLDYLKTVRFTGKVRALTEGRLFFAGEPILEVAGPIIEAQIVETY